MKELESTDIPIILVLMLLCTTFLNAQREWPDGRSHDDPNTWNWNVSDSMDHVTHGTIHSNAMNRDIGYNIYLPPSYDTDPKKRYSVVYYLHGAGGDEKVAAYTTEIIIPEIEGGQVEEAIFVFVNGGHWSGYRDAEESYVRSETYIIKELIPAIDDRYRTIANRSGRAIFGFSMGGGGSIRLALKYPEMFCAVASVSGALNMARDKKTGKESTAQKVYPDDNVFSLAELNQTKIRDQMGLLLTIGGSEWLYDDHPLFLDQLTRLEIKFDYRVKGDLGHNWGKSKMLFGAQVVRFLGDHYQAPMDR